MRTKNRPILLARAFASVLSQMHADWHLYLVNDGGDARVVDELVERYARQFAGRMTVIHHEKSLGMEAASNAALHRSTGDFIVVHDDDDSWHPDFLAATTSFLRNPANDHYAAALSHCTIIYERIGIGCVIEELRVDGFCPEQIDLGDMIQQNRFPPISLLIRRSTVDVIGDYNENLPVLGDWDYNLRILFMGDIGVIPRKLAYYHHRRSVEQNAYGNTVIAGVARHELYITLYRNSMLRHMVQTDPGRIAVIHILAKQASKNHEDLSRRLIQVEQVVIELRQIAAMVNQCLRPIRWGWRRLYPLRRIVAKIRGRVPWRGMA